MSSEEMKGMFTKLPMAPIIENFALMAECAADEFPNKVDLSLGAYRSEEALPWVMPVVTRVRNELLQTEGDKGDEYEQGVSGSQVFRSAATRLLLGETSPAILQNRVDSIQTVGGTGSIRLGLEFLRRVLNRDTIYISAPAWPNYRNVARALDYKKIVEYRYWDNKTFQIDMQGLTEDVKNAPLGSVLVLQMCGHNPAGLDPSRDQWIHIKQLCKERDLFVFFDCTYQGLSSGSLDEDAWPLRHFIGKGFQLLASQSFSKNFGLYNERVGQLIYVLDRSECLMTVRSLLEDLAHHTWWSPSNLGSKIVTTVLTNPQLYSEWTSNLSTMYKRTHGMRTLLHERITGLSTPGSWDHLLRQTGLFFYSGLSVSHVEYLRSKYHIYVISDGRFNIAGLTTDNIDYVTRGIHDSVITLGPPATRAV